MRILHVITSLDAGGAQQMLARIATHNERTHENGFEHIVVSLMHDGKYATDLRQAGTQVHCLGMQGRSFSFQSLFTLMKLIRQQRPDVVMTWLYHADLLGTIAALFAGMSPKKVVWNLRCSNIDFAQYAPTTRLVVRMLSWMSFLPGAIAVNSNSGREHHAGLGYKPRKWFYLPNGLDTQLWKPDAECREQVRKEFGVAEDETLVGMVARVDPQKDHTAFLRSAELVANKFGNARFILVGDGASALTIPPSLEGRLAVTGYRQDIPNLMRALDIHVLSSAFGEGFPNVVCEAMASGVPCVVTDVGQAAQIVEGVGIAVPPRNPQALADAVSTILSEPTETRRKRGEASRNKVLREFDIAKIFDLYGSVWTELAKVQ